MSYFKAIAWSLCAKATQLSLSLLLSVSAQAYPSEAIGNLFYKNGEEPISIIPASIVENADQKQLDDENVNQEEEEEQESAEPDQPKEEYSNNSSSSLQDLTMMFMMGYALLQQLRSGEGEGLFGGGDRGGDEYDYDSDGCSDGSCDFNNNSSGLDNSNMGGGGNMLDGKPWGGLASNQGALPSELLKSAKKPLSFSEQ